MEKVADQIGERLRMARESAGLSVDDIIFRTRIPRSVVLALESGDFSVFSSPTYAKSFLSQYSSFLDVDAELWLDALEPASFVAGEVSPIYDGGTPRRNDGIYVQEPESNGLSTFVFLLISCGVVFLAFKGYDFFESRFGLDFNSGADKRELDRKLVPMLEESPAKPVVEPEPVPEEIEEKVITEPAPRAILVR